MADQSGFLNSGTNKVNPDFNAGVIELVRFKKRAKNIESAGSNCFREL